MRVFTFFCLDIMVRILFSCESDKTFAIYVDSKRFKTGDDYVEAKVEFVAVKEKRIVNVSRHYRWFSFVYFF